MDTVMSISQLEPYGAQNPEPIFVLKDMLIEEIAPLSLGKHTRIFLRKNQIGVSAVCFGHNLLNAGFCNGQYADVLCSVNINEFRGNKTVQLIVRDIDYSDKILSEVEVYENRFLKLKDGECFFANQDIPEREDFVLVYKWIREENYKKEKLLTLMKLKSLFPSFSYLKILIILETFCECNLITLKKISIAKYRVCQLETKDKKNLFSAPIMKRLKQ